MHVSENYRYLEGIEERVKEFQILWVAMTIRIILVIFLNMDNFYFRHSARTDISDRFLF